MHAEIEVNIAYVPLSLKVMVSDWQGIISPTRFHCYEVMSHGSDHVE